MAHIQHIAMTAHDQEKVAEFYKKTFGMFEVARPVTPGKKRGIYLSDGHINLAILYAPEDAKEGINHFGFFVDDTHDAEQTALENGAIRGFQEVPQDGRFSEGNIKDPIGQSVDLSSNGWKVRLE